MLKRPLYACSTLESVKENYGELPEIGETGQCKSCGVTVFYNKETLNKARSIHPQVETVCMDCFSKMTTEGPVGFAEFGSYAGDPNSISGKFYRMMEEFSKPMEDADASSATIIYNRQAWLCGFTSAIQLLQELSDVESEAKSQLKEIQECVTKLSYIHTKIASSFNG